VVVFFSAGWSEECKYMTGFFNELAKDKKISSSLRVLEVEAEDYEDISMTYGIEAVPSFLFLKVLEPG
jgi:thioredoxin-like negative regulator of GroEL